MVHFRARTHRSVQHEGQGPEGLSEAWQPHHLKFLDRCTLIAYIGLPEFWHKFYRIIFKSFLFLVLNRFLEVNIFVEITSLIFKNVSMIKI